MHAAVRSHAPAADIVVMAAAVADYTPLRRAEGKIEKTAGPLELSLVRTTDILAALGRERAGSPKPVLIGFAAESGDPVERGRAKAAPQRRRPDRRQRHLDRGLGLRLRAQRRFPHHA